MIHPLVKIITVDGFFSQEEATRLFYITQNLKYVQHEFGQEIENFNMVSENADQMFSNLLNTSIEVDKEKSGIFRKPELFIHFEPFAELNEWIFACALRESTFNIYEHQTGATSALEGYEFGYRNLFEWECRTNYILRPGQGVLFRPWLFHSFDYGLIQIFRLKETDGSKL